MTTVTLTFDNILGTQTSYTEKGFTITAAEGASPPFYHDSTVLGVSGYSGGALVDFENQVDTFASAVGPFSVSSIQLEGRSGTGGPYTFTGIKADGTIVTQTFQLDGNIGFQTFNFDSDFSNLVALKTDDASFAWIDNVIITYGVGPPSANPDFTDAVFGQQDSVTAPGVLANDTPYSAGDTLTVSAVSVNGTSTAVTASGTIVLGHYGSLLIFPDGHYTYTASGASPLPSSGVSEEVFGYTALEGGSGGGGSTSSTLSVLVTAPGFTVIGSGQSNTTIQGPNGHSPVLDGSAGNDILIAGKGATVLVGGPNDTLTGNKGADTYVFMGNFGDNTITNYNPAKDVIQLSAADFGTNPAALASFATQAPDSPNTVITDPINHDTITLIGVGLSSLHFDGSHFVLA